MVSAPTGHRPNLRFTAVTVRQCRNRALALQRALTFDQYCRAAEPLAVRQRASSSQDRVCTTRKVVVVNRRVALLAPAMTLLGCSPSTQAPTVTVGDSASIPVYNLSRLPAWDDPKYLWDVIPERTIPTAAESPGAEPLLYHPQAYARLGDGTLVVLDGADLRIAILHPSRKEVVRRFARSGQGPGEIWSSNSVIWAAGPDAFWVLDQDNQRLTRFNVSGAVEEERPIRLGGNSRYVLQDPVQHAPWFRNSFTVRQGDVVTLVDSIGRLDLDVGEAVYIAPMSPREGVARFNAPRSGPSDVLAPVHWFAALGPRGVVSGRSDSGRFQVLSTEGTVEGVIDIPMERAEVPESERFTLLEDIGAPRGSSWYVGERFPVWELMWGVGDSLFALQQSYTSTPRGEPRIPLSQRLKRVVWRVFTTGGRYAGTIVLPDGVLQPYWIERGRVIGTNRDKLGVVTIEEFRIEKPEGVP